MTATPTETPAPVTGSALDPKHEHTSRCYWDLNECRWHCPAPSSTDPTSTLPRS